VAERKVKVEKEDRYSKEKVGRNGRRTMLCATVEPAAG